MSKINHFFDCEHPRMATNKYTGERITIPCGHCDACKVRKITRWVGPIIRESTSHKYTYFVTLTYQDKYLPTVNINNYEVDKKYKKEFDSLCKSSKRYLDLCKGNLPYCPSSDIQKFIKRLRERVFRSFGLRNSIRFFFSSDFGSTLFRPHWHGLLFFSDERIRNNIESLVSDSWSVYNKVSKQLEQIGIIDIQPAYSAASYVSVYINTDSERPDIYKFRDFRSKSYHSSNPPIGSLVSPLQSTEKILREGLDRVTYYDGKANTWREVSLPPYLVCRYFPRIPSYLSLDKSERFQIYRIFKDTFYLDPEARRGTIFELMKVNTFLTNYLTLNQKNLSVEQIDDKIDRVYYAVKTFFQNSERFKISPHDYDDLIHRYFMLKKSNALKRQLNYEDNYSFTHLDIDKLLFAIDIELSSKKNVMQFLDINDISDYKMSHFDNEYFDFMHNKCNKLIKRKLDNAYLEKNPQYKQFHK